ncbi:MAG: arylamine N-acetyltransferase [Anaerolineales bacterium]|nr:arylamine N-acetyltransferase [Anaerolineales bacterium]
MDLPAPLIREVLAYLAVTPSQPNLRFLNQLLRAYVRRVPWESASRIARRAHRQTPEACPRWPDEFWASAITSGAGGTCFESNYAFFALLRALGYHGYLTINDMAESSGCHTAIVVDVAGGARLVDVGFPIPVALRLDSGKATRTQTIFHTYVVRPLPDRCYQIERTVHPKRYMFTLIDRPVADEAYRAATTRDYGADGLFLDRVIFNKVIDDHMWRFNSDLPTHFSAFNRIGYAEEYIETGSVVSAVSNRFGFSEQLLGEAFNTLAQPDP